MRIFTKYAQDKKSATILSEKGLGEQQKHYQGEIFDNGKIIINGISYTKEEAYLLSRMLKRASEIAEQI